MFFFISFNLENKTEKQVCGCLSYIKLYTKVEENDLLMIIEIMNKYLKNSEYH